MIRSLQALERRIKILTYVVVVTVFTFVISISILSYGMHRFTKESLAINVKRTEILEGIASANNSFLSAMGLKVDRGQEGELQVKLLESTKNTIDKLP